MNKIALMLTASAALLVSTPGYPQRVDTATHPDAVNREFPLQRDAIGGRKSVFAKLQLKARLLADRMAAGENNEITRKRRGKIGRYEYVGPLHRAKSSREVQWQISEVYRFGIHPCQGVQLR